MTEFIEGMTPAEFVAALNDNFKEYWGEGGVVEILTTDGYVAAINTSFGETTVAFGQSGIAFKNSLDKFNTFTHTLEYSGNGTSIDLTKFDIINLDATTDVTFEQSKNITNKVTGITTNEKWNAILMNSLPSGSRVVMYRNQIRSVESITYGVCSFCLANLFRVNNWIRVGLSDTTNLNRIEISAYGANTLKYSIWEAGVEVYTTATGVIDFGQFQLVVSPIGKISAWILTNDVWVQIGTTKEYSLGSLKFYMSSEGAVAGLTSLTDIYITSRKFTTIKPGITNTTRAYGEVPDGTTDNSVALNAALVTGDIMLENGVFLYSDSLKIPSNREIGIRNAKLWKKDNSLDNAFRNSDFTVGNENIKVKGYGNAILDGNAAGNDDGYETYSEMEREDVWDWSKVGADFYHYVNIPLINVIGLEISGLYIFNTPHWNIITQHVSQGVIKNCLVMYKPLLVPANTDAFNPLWGSNNIDIYNLKTLTDDDVCYLGCGREDFAVVQQGPARVGDVTDINIQDITVYSTGGRSLLMVASEGNKVNNIHWGNIKTYAGYTGLMIHYPDYYVIPPSKDDMKDIIIDNVTIQVNALADVIKVNDDCKNIKMTNIVNNSGKELVAFESGLDIENFTINGVEYP